MLCGSDGGMWIQVPALTVAVSSPSVTSASPLKKCITAEVEADVPPIYGLALGVTFRKDSKSFQTFGSCDSFHEADGSSGKGVHCGVDCDGGTLDVTLRDAKSVRVAIPQGVRLWEPGTEDDEPGDSEIRRFGADDKLFRLDRAALKECVSLAGDDAAALRRGE